MQLTFSEAMLATIAAGTPNLTAEQSDKLQKFFGADPSDPATQPEHVKLLEWIVYHRAVREGVVSKETPMTAVNWNGILQFLAGLLPLIEALIKLFGG